MVFTAVGGWLGWFLGGNKKKQNLTVVHLSFKRTYTFLFWLSQYKVVFSEFNDSFIPHPAEFL